MHDEPRSDHERRAYAAWEPAEPPPGFADRVLQAEARGRESAAPAPGRLFARPLRAAALALATLSAAGLGLAGARGWLSFGAGPEEPVQEDTSGPRDAAPVDGALPESDPKPAAPLALPADLDAKIDAYVGGFGRSYGDAFRFHGAVAVLRDGELVFSRGYGRQGGEPELAIGPDTRFRIGSLTQIFTAAAVLQLRDQGVLDLDAPLRKYLPDYPAIGERISLRQLLSHTSGLPNYTERVEFMSIDGRPRAPAEVRALFEDRPLQFAPGSDFDLSNAGYYLLGLVVEQASGQPFATYVQRNLFAPAGMRRSDIGGEPDARGHEFDEDEVLVPAPQRHPSAYGAAAAMVSTVADLAAWDRALRSPGLVLSQRSLDEMTTLVRDDYGLGWFLKQERGQTLAWHPGGVEGYNATIVRYLGDGLTVIVLANTEAVDARTVAYAVAELAHGEEVPPPVEHREVATSADLARYAGTYALSETSRRALAPVFGEGQLASLEHLEVQKRGARLVLSVPLHADKWMHPMGDDRFFFKDPAATLAEFGPPGAPVDRLTLRQGDLEFVLRRVGAAAEGSRPRPVERERR